MKYTITLLTLLSIAAPTYTNSIFANAADVIASKANALGSLAAGLGIGRLSYKYLATKPTADDDIYYDDHNVPVYDKVIKHEATNILKYSVTPAAAVFAYGTLTSNLPASARVIGLAIGGAIAAGTAFIVNKKDKTTMRKTLNHTTTFPALSCMALSFSYIAAVFAS